MKTGYVYKKANKANPSVPNILKKKVLQIALMIMLTTQIVQPFFVAYADVNRNGLINNNNGPAKAQATGEEVIVDTWSDLEKLDINHGDGDAYVIEGNYTIKLKQDVVAASPIIIKGNVHISSNDNDNKTIYRQKGNTDFSVFTVDNGGTLTLGNKVTMSGQIAETYSKAFKITVTDAYGLVLYEETVYEDEERTPKKILEDAGYSTKEQALNLIKSKTENDSENDSDRPYSLGYKLQETPWDMAGYDDIQMKDVNGNLLIVAKWDNPDPNKVMYVVDGYGNEIYKVEVPSNSEKTPRRLLSEAGINDVDNPNNIESVLAEKLSNVDGPYKLGYTFDGWDLNNEGMKQFKTDFYVVAKWNNPDYIITLTDGYGRTVKTIAIPSNTNKKPIEILSEEGLSDENDTGKANIYALMGQETGSDTGSPYSLGYALQATNPWNMAGKRNNYMDTEIEGHLLISAIWKKPYVFKVTDDNGNVLEERTIYRDSADANKTIIELMQNTRYGDLINDRTNAFNNAKTAWGSSAKTPWGANGWNFTSWDYGNVDPNQTLNTIDGNVTVCAAWTKTGGTHTWEVPTPENGTEIEIGLGNNFVSFNSSNVTSWSPTLTDNTKFVMTDVQSDGSFRLKWKGSAENDPRYFLVLTNGVYGKHNTLIGSYDDAQTETRYSSFFKFVINGDKTYLTTTNPYFTPDWNTNKTRYINIDNYAAIWFTIDVPGDSTNPYVGQVVDDFENADTPGKTDVPNPTGTPDTPGVTPITAPTGTPDTPGTQGDNISTGSVPQTTKPKQSAAYSPASNVEPSESPVKNVLSARYTLGGKDETQIFNREGYGFFVHVNSGGTLDIEGAILTKLITGRLKNDDDNLLNIYDDSTVKNAAPVVVDGGTLHFTSGAIMKNEVGYLPNENKSGMMAQGNNPEDGSGVENFIKTTAMMNTAGGIIFKNGAIGSISRDASIEQNKGDTGGIMVQGKGTDVTLGGYITGTINANAEDPYADADLYIDYGGHIDQNVGFHHAGAALVENGGTLRMVGVDSTMNHNVTWAKGGAVWATDFGTNGYAKIDYKQKYLTNPDKKQPNGGGIFIMKNGTLDNNTAFLRGGAINVQSNRVHLLGGTISNNNSRVLGGGIYVEGDFADYTYTLMIDKGYIGHNYAVRFWDLDSFADDENDIDGLYDHYSLRQLNNRLDRKLGRPIPTRGPVANPNGNPLVDEEWNPDKNTYYAGMSTNGYENKRTADIRAYYKPHEGFGGGVWLCPIGGTAIFHLHNEHEVIIDDNYASGAVKKDPNSGTDIYLHSGTGHILVSNSEFGGEDWINEKTGDSIKGDGETYSGPLYLENQTTDDYRQGYSSQKAAYSGDDYNQKEAANNNENGIRIINNVSRNGGGIGADGTLLFGLPNDVYRHEASLDFVKIWPANNNEDTHPVKFKMFYEKDGELVPISSYDFGLDGTNNAIDDYTTNPELGSTNTPDSNGEIKWSAKVTIPITVQLSDGTQYPMYGLKYNGTETVAYNITDSLTETSITVNPDEVMYPNTRVGMQKLFAIAQESEKIVKNGGSPIELEIVDWKLVIKEYDDKGQELRTAEFLNVVGRSVTVSNDNTIPIDVIDAGGVGKKIKGYNINFSSAEFYSEVKNNKGPTIEKYIDKKVHRNLTAFDETFEYEIMAYVPLDADEIIIYDTLEKPLMFVSNSGTPQYTTNSNQVNATFDNEFRNDPYFFMIKNDNGYNQMAIFEENNHLGDGTGTVSNSGTAFTDAVAQAAKGKTNPMKAHNVRIGTLLTETDGRVSGVTAASNGNSLFIKVDKNSGIEAVRGKWIKATFKAAIKPEYRDLEKLKSVGWLTNEDLKVGGPAYYGKSITFTGSGWEKLSGIEEVVGKQFIVNAAAQNPETNSTYRFAKDEDGNYYAIKYQEANAKWFKIKETDEEPSIALAKSRLGEGGKRNGFVDLDLRTSVEYFNHDDFVVANNTSLNGATAKRGAYGNGDWMFLEDSAGNYYYAVKSQNVKLDSGSNKYQLKEGVSEVNWIKVDDIPEGQRPTNLTDSLIEDRLNGNSATKMDLTSYSYNWPIEDEENHMSQQPHQGEANQAHMVVDAKNTYNSNIVTVDILQPEKYVNDKVHEILRHDQSAEGAFDQVFEYEIMVYVPKDVQEFVIWDTLRDDLMFVDRHGKTQYRTYTIGTKENPVSSTQHGNDILNTEFMSQVDGQDSNAGMTLIANDGHSIDPENDGNSHQLQWYKTNDHKGDGTGTVSTSGNDVNGPIENAGYIGIIDESNIPANGNWSTLPENNTAGNTIFIKFDETTGIDTVREKWVKVTFFAQIKPSRYIDIVNKLQKSSRHTNDKALAVDYDATANPNPNPVGYNYRTSELTSIKMNAKGYNPVDDTVPAASIKGYYAKNPDTGYFTDFVNSQPSGTEGTDWIYAYESAFVYYAESIDDIPADVKSKGTSEYEAVYLKKGWNDTDDNISWEKVTDDGYVKDGINLYRNNNSKEAYLDVQADGSHAGLANKANYAIKIDNKWNSISTNTVTVVPLLRTITVKKMWIVDEDTPIPSAHELLEHIHLYWEKITNLDDTQSSDHGRTVGKITELYRNNITIVQEKVEDLTGKTRYTWRIEVKDLPQLRPSMKYFIEEDQFDGFNPPRYLNPSDPEATEHAHDTGSIINSMDSDDTELLVTKKWDVGAGDYENENIRVRLLADGEPVWKRDNQFKIVRDENNNKIEDTSYTKDINSAEEWFILFNSLPKYQRDDNGNYITEPATDINGVAIIDEVTNQQVQNKIPIVYSIEVLSDPEGYILSEVYRRESNYIESYTYNKQEADDFFIDLDGYTTNDARHIGKATLVGYYVYDVITEQIPYDDSILERSYVDYNSGVFYSVNDIDISSIEGRCNPDLPSTPGSRKACYLEAYRKTESYLSYEVDLVNTKPQIEKYINKDVHYETFIGNEFTYDIIVYVPEEATEIEIVDELLPTLVLKSIEEPEISGPQSKEITGYNSISISDLPSEISLAVHGNNDHTIYGTVDSDTVFGNVKGTVNTYGNGFKVKIINIVPYGASYVVDENGEYLYVKDHLGNKYYKKADELSYYKEIEYDSSNTDDRADSVYVRVLDNMDNTYQYWKYSKYLLNNDNPERFTMDPGNSFYEIAEYRKIDDNHYRSVNQKRYVEKNNGDFIKLVNKSDSYKILFVDKNTDLTEEQYADYEILGTKYYSYDDSVDQAIGGKYVQVTFKAGFDLTDSKVNAMKQWISNPWNFTSSNPNPELNWDVITHYGEGTDGRNKDWDKYIESLGYNKATDKFIPADSVMDYQIVNLMNAIGKDNISSVIKKAEYYVARANNNLYICPINPTQFPENKDVWLKVDQGVSKFNQEYVTRFFTLDNEEVEAWENTGYNYDYINSNSQTGTNLLVDSSRKLVPIQADEYVLIDNNYYLRDVAKLYAPNYDDSTVTIYRKIDWGRGDGDVIRNNSSEYRTNNHAGVVNTASYEVTYGNGYKSNHKSNTVTVVPQIYELPSSGGMGTFLFNILGAMFITLALTEIMSKRHKRRKNI